MKQRNIELLSAYLDGELKSSDLTRLEARLRTDPELDSVLNDLRAARTLLRKLPSRKAPRNFTLTRKMAGQNPPLPRLYPAFRLATTIATLMFFFTFGLNFVGSQLASSEPMAFGMGGGGGSEFESYAAEPAMEEPAMDQFAAPAEEPLAAAPAPEPTMSVSAEDDPSIALAPPSPTEMPAEDTARIIETPVMKDGEGENAVEPGQPPVAEQAMPPVENPSPSSLISPTWQGVLAVVAVAGLLVMGLMRQLSARRWK